jgi:hypothetical protein
MSAILVTDVMERVEAVIDAFRRQNIADRLELILGVAPDTAVPGDLGSGFGALVVVRVSDPFDISAARADCVRAATTPVVAIGETHCMPEPNCCEALLTGFEDPDVAIIGARVLCANPGTTMAQAAHLLDYGPWAQGDRGERTHLAAHNVAFRRDFLLELGDDLAHGLDVNTGLNDRFLAQGRKLMFEPAARWQHLNVSKPAPWLKERLLNGRAYAGQVSQRWTRHRRLAYGLAWPLIAVVRFVRLTPISREAGVSPRAFPAFVLALGVASAGEGWGFLTGPGGAPRYRRRIEIEKGLHIRPGEASAALAQVLALHEPA